MQTSIPLITVLGPTAVGKTILAAQLAQTIGGEIISADSRQVFKGMDIGTGKDKLDYFVKGEWVPYHLVDIVEAGSEYSLFSFVKDFLVAYQQIIHAGKVPILCGGTGLYLDAILRGYNLEEVPVDKGFREKLANFSDRELVSLLKEKKLLHNTTDSLDRQRIIRALEIEAFRQDHQAPRLPDFLHSMVFGLRFERRENRERISRRLLSRLNNGLIEEVNGLLSKGVSHKILAYYGLEYRFVSMYLSGEIDFDTMFNLLNTAIHQFAKRQMTWFRRMEKNGVEIHWLEGEDGMESNLGRAIEWISLREMP